MLNRNQALLGGVSGLLAVLVMIPAYVIGIPDSPSTLSEAGSYFPTVADDFVFANGTLPLFHVFFFLLFLGVLYGVVRNAESGVSERTSGFSAAVLAGGITFIVLTSAGFTAEILYPATVARFGEVEPDAPFVLISLTLSSWLYHFCQVGTSVMVLATSIVVLGTGAFPRWLGLLGFVVAILTLLHFTIPLIAALSGLVWIALISVIMLAGGLLASPGRSRATETSR